MLLKFDRSPLPHSVRSRRGTNIYRVMDIPAHVEEFEYPALPDCVVELTQDGTVVGDFEIGVNIPRKAHVAIQNGGSAKYGPSSQDTDNVQPVGTAVRPHGGHVQGANDVQVPPLDKGNARLGSPEERGAEVGTDGVHSSVPEPSPVHDRPTPPVGTVPAPVENAGRDELLKREVRSGTGNEPAPSGTVLGREKRGNEAGGVSDPVYKWKQQS